ncbi:NAD(P)/FAD-dependent oxidoreductase [Pelagibius litoralis]|uniref:NAD(P)/FAD-dependent oxidoreductase n=1 Tax=Pelagibius litoralis TaxID=374515 RepID=UPI002AC31A18|nr:FAD-dependent oxidoreductase [Pelagibius litoralis]
MIIVGAGMVGSAVAYGLARAGRRVLVLDGGDGDFRAARANFGLVWVQGKGADMPAYQVLTRDSSDLWPQFAGELAEVAGVPVDYERKGGLAFCLGDRDFEARGLALHRLHNQLSAAEQDCEMLDRVALEKRLPRVEFGNNVSGASYCWRDGQVNPLRLLQAMHAGIERLGGRVLAACEVSQIERGEQGFRVATANQVFGADKVVIAAGVATKGLALQVGLDVPLRPQRGQVLVTERMAPFLPLPASGLRQTAEGTVMIGATKEEVGLDAGTTMSSAAYLADKALQVVPRLAGARLVRQWSGLRVMTPDSFPVYAQSQSHPGAFALLCHSGVTLAACHAERLAEAIDRGVLPANLEPFHHQRFSRDVRQAI